MSSSIFKILYRSLTMFSGLLMAYADLIAGYPLEDRATAIQQSSDAWAQVIANVAPLMALVGERNTKEHMRTASSFQQLLPLATAPLGILSVLVSAIRISGPGFLRRLVGRDSERRSEALVELTPLSVAPATSVYTQRAVEIEPSYSVDKVAFVCGHVGRIEDTNSALEAFKALFQQMSHSSEVDRDTELSLALWQSSLSLEKLAEVACSIQNMNTSDHQPVFNQDAAAAISYRTTGISPTQTARTSGFWPSTASQWQDICVSLMFALPCIGLQVLGLYLGSISAQTFWMGIIGYLAVVAFNMCLLVLIQSETVAEPESLPPMFKDAYWTFSDSRHAEHKPVGGPPSNTLVVARPISRNPSEIHRRQIITTLLTLALCTAYVLFYLSMRVAPWWVALGILGVIWSGALYRAITTRNFLVATAEDTGKNEHWIGMFRNTLDESLLATLEFAEVRLPPASTEKLESTKSDNSAEETEYIVIKTKGAKDPRPEPLAARQTALFVIPPFRTAMRTWSGAEDVMKVGLEVARLACQDRVVSCQTRTLPPGKWRTLVRFHMIIYVPGLIWRSRQAVDFALVDDFDLGILIRLVVKLLHVCLDHEGDLSTHVVDPSTSVELSHVLCGPIADVEGIFDDVRNSSISMRTLLQRLRDHPSCAESKKFSIDQAILLPTMMLASFYENFLWPDKPGSRISSMQKRHVDGLSLSGKLWVPTMMRELEARGLLAEFLRPKEGVVPSLPSTLVARNPKLEPRDANSGDYLRHNVRENLSATTRSWGPVGGDGQAADEIPAVTRDLQK